MRTNAHNKENVDPKASTAVPDTPVADNTETDFEDADGFVEVNLGAVNGHRIEENSNSNSGGGSSTTQADKKGKGVDTNIDEDDEDMGIEGMDGLGGMESLAEFGDVGLEELLEIEKEIPDELELDTPEASTQPYEPFENRSSGSQSSPLSQIHPPVVDPNDMPTSLQVRKSSYFSQDSPMQTNSVFEEDGEEEEEVEEADNWFEEGEIEEDGIRRHEVEMSFAEWRLNRHPRFGRYRVRETSCLRVCETIEHNTPTRTT